MKASRRDLLAKGLPMTAMLGSVHSSQGPAARVARAAMADGGLRSVEEFGAVGDFDPRTGIGTDDTRAFQRAIDWAYANGTDAPRAVFVDAKNYLCGQITTHPTSTMIGTGRHTSAIWCRPGTGGHWWSDRGGGAQKLMLSGLAFYGRHEPGLESIARFGRDGIQFGTEGILEALWFRDARNAVGLDISGNVGVLNDITLQDVDTGIIHFGNANQLTNIFSMEARIGAQLAGCFVRGLHIEAVRDGGVPLKMTGDCRISDAVFSLAHETRFEHLIEIEPNGYEEWSLSGIQIFEHTARLSRSLLKIGDRLVGGTDLSHPYGLNVQPGLALHGSHLSLAGHAWRSFAVDIRAGNVSLVTTGSQDEASILERLFGAFESRDDRPGSLGAKIEWRDNALMFDTPPIDPEGFSLIASIAYNSSGRPVTVEAGVAQDADNRLQLVFHDGLDGSEWSASALGRGERLRIAVMGFGGDWRG